VASSRSGVKIELGFYQARCSIPKSSFTGDTKNLRERRNLDRHSYDAAAHHQLYNVGPANDHHPDDSIPDEPVFDIKRDEPGARRNGGYALCFVQRLPVVLNWFVLLISSSSNFPAVTNELL
jgi:hypothetical protein